MGEFSLAIPNGSFMSQWQPQEYDPRHHADRLAQPAPQWDAQSASHWQSGQTPHGYQQPPQYQPPQYQPPQTPPRQPPARATRRRVIISGTITAGALIIGIIIGSAAASGKTTAAAAPAPAVTVTVTAQAAAHSKAAPAKSAPAKSAPAKSAPAKSAPAKSAPSASPAPATTTVATFSGSGIQSTPRFTVTNTWKLDYTYDCSSFGGSGNFIVDEDGGNDFDGASVNALGAGGSSSTWVYDDAGTHYLAVNSECSWTVKIIDEG